jgi:hypothetical protein
MLDLIGRQQSALQQGASVGFRLGMPGGERRRFRELRGREQFQASQQLDDLCRSGDGHTASIRSAPIVPKPGIALKHLMKLLAFACIRRRRA